MLKHIVLWTLKEPAGGRSAEENALEMKARIEALNGRIPGLIKVEVGISLGRIGASADVVLYSEFPDRPALLSYQSHAEHVAVAGFVGSLNADRIVVDYEV